MSTKQKAWSVKENNLDKFIKIVFFIVSPIFGFLYSLKNIKTKSSYVIFFLTAICFGISFTVERQSGNENDFDSFFYREEFESFQSVDYLEYIDGLKDFLSFDEGRKDYYYETIAFFVSRFTNNYHYLFAVFAIVFSFFALKTFRFLTEEENFKNNLSSYILAYIFLTNQIFNINGVRFWTAAWVAVFIVFQVFRNKKYQYLLLMALLPFMHGSYWIFIFVVFVYILLSRFYRIFIALFFFSFIFSSISLQLAKDSTSFLPVFLAKLIDSYTSAETIEKVSAQGTGFFWIAKIFKTVSFTYMNLLVYLFIRNEKLIKENVKTESLYKFLLVLVTFANFTMSIPSLGGRFFLLSYPIIAYIWLINFGKNRYKYILYFFPLAFFFNIYEQLILYLKVTGVYFYISSPFYIVYEYLF